MQKLKIKQHEVKKNEDNKKYKPFLKQIMDFLELKIKT